jgi:transposase
MGLVKQDDGWRVPDELWAKIEPLLPPRPKHPLGCHNPRTPDRRALDAILLVLRTGMQWQALNATGICGYSSAYRRFREWLAAGVFLEFWRQGLLAYQALAGIDWKWLSLDGAMGKAPLGGEKNGPQPHRQSEEGHQEEPADGWTWGTCRYRGRRRQHPRFQVDARHRGVHTGAAAGSR